MTRWIPRHKFHAIRTEADGMSFSSLAEARYYEILKGRQAAGEIVFFLRQVPFHLPGSVKYVCDFLVFLASGEVEIIDVKGMSTPLFEVKRKLVESIYPITIKVVKVKGKSFVE